MKSLRKILVNWDDYSQYMGKQKSSKPPISICVCVCLKKGGRRREILNLTWSNGGKLFSCFFFSIIDQVRTHVRKYRSTCNVIIM